MWRLAGIFYERFLSACGLMAGISIGVMALLITTDVVLRNLEVDNFPWLLEVSEYVLYVSTFMAAPWVLRLGAHVRVDLLLQSVPRGAARILDFVTNLIGLAIACILVRHGGRIAWDAYARSDLLFKEIVIPEWPLLIVIPIAGGMLAVEFARRIAMAILGRDPELPEQPDELDGF